MTSAMPGHRFLWVVLSLAAAAIFAACAQKSDDGLVQPGQIIGGGTKQITDVQPVGGFLPNPSLLHPGGSDEAALLYRSPSFSPSSYKKVMLDPVTVWTGPNSQLNGVPPEQRQALADTFQADLLKAISQRCQIVTSPSPGTMRVRVALVDAEHTNAAVNTFATYAPYVSAANSLAAVAFNNGVGYFAGSATAEGYMTDAETGALLWEAVDKRGGTTAAAENTLNTWLDVQHAFEAWSNQFAKKLETLGACS